ncbi:MAG: hypothetical protein GX862_05780 [Leucobacter sp.]|jgi:hypothetical protein|nr:hypothetical protein [Leucobacter sp.]
MAIGKYLTNMGVIGAAVGAMGVLKQTQSMPRDWRRFIVWLVWAAGLLLAVAAVAKQPEDEAYEAELKQQVKQAKAAAKAARKAS